MDKYDLIVIGAGPAGYKAAELAAKRFSVALFENAFAGGVCLNEGCVPTKSLLHTAKQYYAVKSFAVPGVGAAGAPDWRKIMHNKEKQIKILRAGVTKGLKDAGVAFIRERAVILGKRDGLFEVESPSGRVCSERLLIATGSEPVAPPVKGLDEAMARGRATFSSGALDIDGIPETFAVIGGGVIGAETAAMYAMFGARVTLCEAESALTASPDSDCRALIKKTLERLGVTVLLSAKVNEILPDGIKVSVAGEETEVPAEKILVCTGRKPRLTGYGLENLSPKIERGIVCDEYMRTSVPGMWVAGDVNGKMMLAHKAYREAETAVKDMFGASEKMRYDSVPSVVYLEPEFASVGACCGEGLKEYVFPAAYSPRYVTESAERDGFVKFVVDPVRRVLAGAHLAVPYASEIIGALAAFIHMQTPLGEIKNLCFPHPGVAELISLIPDEF